MKNLSVITLVCVIGLATCVTAQPVFDDFWAEAWPGGFVVGGGSGYNGGEWYQYDSGWSNQWYYDHPPRPEAWKWIDVFGTVEVLDPWAYGEPPGPGMWEGAWATVAINYTTEDWPDSSAPPLPGDDEAYIVREIIFDGPLWVDWWEDPVEPGLLIPMPFPEDIYGYTEILDYNPEWVSIDIMGENFLIYGQIVHECVPEPATLAVLLLGGLAALIRRRK